jgi:hypothetical protein
MRICTRCGEWRFDVHLCGWKRKPALWRRVVRSIVDWWRGDE